MMDIIEVLREKQAFVSLKKGASLSDIQLSEEKLSVKFADDYKDYTSVFGAASYYGHELTGVCNSKSLNVVTVTIQARELFGITDDMYVIEETHIDDILIWQKADGKIYRTIGKSEPKKICDSLMQYIRQD